MGRTAISPEQRAIDERHVARCLQLARAYEGRTAPNPIVGCVIVDRQGKVIAEGGHRRAGTDHAEIVALKKLGGKARGATLYVSLEPCNHHGRTPPCAPAVRDSGVARVVVGMPDPVPGHGGGIGVLRRAGIEVTSGVLRAACERANLPWITFVTKQRPAFVLKAAITLDGKIATVSGDSRWVTGDAARASVMQLRDRHDAIMVGVGTVLADDPWLTARVPKGRDPVRVILDSQLRTPPGAHVTPKSNRRRARTIVACGPKASALRERALVNAGCEVWRTAVHRNGRIDGHALGKRLADENIMSVFVEGGGETHAYLIDQGLCDLAYLYIAPKVVGGPAPSWVGGTGLRAMGSAVRFVIDEQIEDFAGDLRLTLRPASV